MELKSYLAEMKGVVEKALDDLLPGEGDYPQGIHKAMRYSLFAGGKRLRPILVLAASDAVSGSRDAALPTACAFECIHTYSLVHDDLPAMDDDDLRRGKPTCHKMFGDATALLAGDALLTAAFGLIARTTGVDPARVTTVVGELARAAGSMGMIGGQLVDIESTAREVSFPVLEYIHIHKTGELIRSAIRCGAILGGATEEELSALNRYGEATGLAFQIADDILDVEGDSAELGKPVGGDAAKGKATYPALLGLQAAKERAGELTEMALEAISGFDEKADPLRRIAEYTTSRTN